MNKRSFFKSLALLAGAASISPNIFIPKFESVHWKRTRQIAVINPSWLDAPHEVQYAHMLNLRDLAGKWNFVTHPMSPSLRFVLDHGRFVEVPQYVIANQ